MVNVKNEISSPFVSSAPYERWVELQVRVRSIFWLITDVNLALEGGEGDRLYQVVQPELEAIVNAMRSTFEDLSQAATLRSPEPLEGSMEGFSDIIQALRDRLIQVDADRMLSADIDPAEIRRTSAVIYGFRAIASDLRDLVEALKPSTVRSR